jgi:hypothetical protein
MYDFGKVTQFGRFCMICSCFCDIFREFFENFRKCEISHQTVVFIETTTQIPKSGDKQAHLALF